MKPQLTKKTADIIVGIQRAVKKNDLCDINHGGCAYFARFVYEKLRQLGIDAGIFAYAEDQHFKKYNNGEDTSFCHVFLKLGKFYFDGEDTVTDRRKIMASRGRKFVQVEYDFLTKTTPIEDEDLWNSSFSIKERLKLKDIVEEFFANIRTPQLQLQLNF